MYRKRPTSVTISSFKALSKVCRPHNFPDSIKALGFVRTLSTACERSDFQTPSEFNGDNYQQNPSSFRTEKETNEEIQRGFEGHGSLLNPGGFNGKITTGCWNSSTDAHGEKLASLNLYGSNGEWQQLAQGNASGFWGQKNLMSSGTLNGSYGQRAGQFGNIADSHPNANNYHKGAAQHSPGSIGSQPNSNVGGSYVPGYGSYQQNSNELQGGGYQQNVGGSYVPNYENYQQNSNELQGGGYQQNVGGSYVPNYENYQQNSNELQGGGYQQNAGGRYQQNSNESWNGLMDPHAASHANPDNKLVEGEKSSEYRGTLEELDGFCRDGKLKEAVEVLGLLDKQGIPVDLARYLSLIKACGEAKSLQEAKFVHEHLIKSVSAPKVSTYNKILEMYGKCGSMEDAYAVFDYMPQRNLTSWDIMITWLAKNGLGEDAIELFAQFKTVGLKPDGQMFIGVFAACGVVGDIIEGMMHFESMTKDHGIVPSMKHYISVVDMLGSAGCLDEALEFIEKMPVKPSVDVWETLMNLCRVYGNMELGDRCAEIIELIEPSRLNDQSKAGLIPVKASDIAKEKEKKKLAAENLLAVRSRVHEYRAGDTSHPEKDRIYALLRGMKEQMKEAGYIAETRFVLHDIDQEGKEEALLAHSERLAVAYGLISSPVRAPIRIIKNLRVCGDCHSSLKIISELVGRELIIRDAKRFHHFKDGLCSCRDYW
ncbi:hypothetical protein NMG60_11025915 [Bertholletia excelsa]